MLTDSRPPDALCRGFRRMCTRCLSAIREQAPDVFRHLVHAWLNASRKKKTLRRYLLSPAGSTYEIPEVSLYNLLSVIRTFGRFPPVPD